MKNWIQYDVIFAVLTSVKNYGGVGLFDYKMPSFTQVILISQTDDARMLFYDFLILFCIGHILVN